MTARIAFDRLPGVVCVTGCRGFRRRDWVIGFVERLRPDTTLVHGAAPGSPDEWAGVAATGRGFAVMPFPADWGRYGPTGGARRTRDMLNCVAAWGGVLVAFGTLAGEPGPATAGAIRYAGELGVPFHLIGLAPDGSVTTHGQAFDPYLELPTP